MPGFSNRSSLLTVVWMPPAGVPVLATPSHLDFQNQLLADLYDMVVPHLIVSSSSPAAI
jgi:hypothetical protein